MVVLLLLLGCSQVFVVLLVLLVLQPEHLMDDLVLVVPQLEHSLVDWVLEVVQLVHLGVDLGDNVKNLLLNLLSLSLLLQLVYLTLSWHFYLYLYLLPVFFTDFALGLTALNATGIHVGKCTDLDLILGLPALDVDAVGLSAIRHSTTRQKFVLPLLKF